MAMQWFVVQAYSGFEKHVMRTLKERISISGMEDKFGDVLIDCVSQNALKIRRDDL